eukprot:Pgem_evm1s3780
MLFKQNGKFLFLDNITNGLDATTSLSVIQYIQKLCKQKHYGALITLLQPSDGLVQCFDKIIVLASDMVGQDTSYLGSRCAYYGSSNKENLLQHFGPSDLNLSLNPRETRNFNNNNNDNNEVNVIDFVLKHCCKVPDVKVQNQLEQQFLIDNNELENENLFTGDLKKNTYQICFFEQFWFSLLRQGQLTIRNKMTYARVVLASFFALVCGSLFCDLGPSLMGTYGIQGYLFLTLFLLLTLSTAVTLPGNFRARPTFLKHNAADFYSPTPYYLSLIVASLPLCILESFILSIVLYWVGLGHGFWYFFGILISLELVGQAYARFLCFVCETEVKANM